MEADSEKQHTGRWNRVYLAVIGFLLVEILLFVYISNLF